MVQNVSYQSDASCGYLLRLNDFNKITGRVDGWCAICILVYGAGYMGATQGRYLALQCCAFSLGISIGEVGTGERRGLSMAKIGLLILCF